MCNNCCKIKAYLGFAKKSSNIVFGVDDIIRCLGKCQLVIVSKALKESSLAKLEKAMINCSAKIIILNEKDFCDKVESELIKAIAITDKNLSDAIKKELDY